jgi:hypothetical protein
MRILAILVVLVFLGALFYLGSRIPPNDSNSGG